MSTKWQRFEIPIPDGVDLDDAGLELLGETYIEYILSRTKDGKGRGDKSFRSYSPEYAKSLNFKNAGKSKGDVNLTLSGDMLGALEVLEIKSDSVVVGFKDGTPENAIADGNIRGTYGQDRANKKKARDFLTATKSELEDHVYPAIADSSERKLDSDTLALANLAMHAQSTDDEEDDGE